jgi:5'(3')-deoxyribonucleotidase
MTRKLSLCVDMDNVVAQTDVVMRNLIRLQTNGRVNLLYEDITEFDYWKCKDSQGCFITRKEWDAVHDAFSKPEIIRSLQPFPEIQSHLHALRTRYVVDIVTSRLNPAHGATEEWLRTHQVPFDNLRFAPHGGKHKLPFHYQAVIEDHYDQAKAFAEIGTTALLIAHPWNRSKQQVNGLEWMESWQDIRRRLLHSRDEA